MVAALDAFPLNECSRSDRISWESECKARAMLRPIRPGTIGPPWLGERRKPASTDFPAYGGFYRSRRGPSTARPGQGLRQLRLDADPLRRPGSCTPRIQRTASASWFSQSLKCGQASRIAGIPISKATKFPKRGFLYLGTNASIRLEGAVSRESSISSGVAKSSRIFLEFRS